jgi:uncharacterized protein YndB with AHSA1/START domain
MITVLLVLSALVILTGYDTSSRADGASAPTSKREVRGSHPGRCTESQGFLGINPTAPAKARQECYIHSPPSRVWSLLTDIDHWREWNHAVTEAKLKGAFASGTVFDWKSNGFSVRSTLREIQPERRLSWTGQAFGTRAVHVWSLVPQADGVRVITAESFDGWLVRLMPGTMQHTLNDSLTAMLASLKRAAEARTAIAPH